MSDETEPEQGDDRQQPEQGTDWRSEADRWREAARRADNRAKSNARAAAELEKLQRAQMTEQERAAAEAFERGVSEATAKLSGRLVRSEIKAAVGGRLGVEQVDALVARLDPAGFLGDDGEVDTASVAAFVESILPAPTEPATGPQFPDLGQGARGSSAVPLNGDPLLRQLKAQLGVR